MSACEWCNLSDEEKNTYCLKMSIGRCILLMSRTMLEDVLLY